MNYDSTRNSVQGLQSVILLINDTSSSSSSLTLYRMSSVSDVALQDNTAFVKQSFNTEVVQE